MEKKEDNYYHLIHNTSTSQSNPTINSINDTSNFNVKENPTRNFNMPPNPFTGKYKDN